MLIISDVGRFALLALFPRVTEVWEIYMLIFVVNDLTACSTPAYEATLTQIVGFFLRNAGDIGASGRTMLLDNVSRRIGWAGNLARSGAHTHWSNAEGRTITN